MFYSLAFIILLLIALGFFLVVLIWQPKSLEPSKTRMVKAISGLAGVGVLITAASLMLQGMETDPTTKDADLFEAFGDEGANRGDSPESDPPQEPSEVDEVEDSGSPAAEPPDVLRPASREGVKVLEDRMLNARGPEPVAQPGGTHDEKVDGDAPTGDASTGSLSKETIQESIRSLTPQVKACYENLLDDFPDAEGKVTISFTIVAEDGEGRVEMSALEQEETSLFDNRLHDCMLKGVGDLKFEVPEDGGKVNVTYPFNFASVED